MTFGEAIKKIISDKGMTMAEAAGYFNIKCATLRNTAEGKTKPHYQTIKAIIAVEPQLIQYLPEKICIHCGKVYRHNEEVVGNGHFCSIECKRAYRRKYRDNHSHEIDQEKYPIAYAIDAIMTKDELSVEELGQRTRLTGETIRRVLRGDEMSQASLKKIADRYPEYGLQNYVQAKICAICKQPFIPNNGKQEFCSEKCQRIRRSEKQKESRKNNADPARPRAKRKYQTMVPDKDIKTVLAESRANGLSYGYESTYEYLGWL